MLNIKTRMAAFALAASTLALAVGMSPAAADPIGDASFTFNSTQLAVNPNTNTLTTNPVFIVSGMLYFNATPLTAAQYDNLNTGNSADSLAGDAAAGFTDYQVTSFSGYLESYNKATTAANTNGLASGYYSSIVATTTGSGSNKSTFDVASGFSTTANAGTNYFVSASGLVYTFSALNLADPNTIVNGTSHVAGGPNDNILGVSGTNGAIDDMGLGLNVLGTAAQNSFGSTSLAYFDSGEVVGNTVGSYVLDNGQEIAGVLNIQVPEPFTVGILGAGLLGFGMIRRRKAV